MSRAKVATVEQEYLTTKSLRECLGGVSKEFVAKLRADGKLPYRAVGGLLFYRISDVRRLVESGKVY